MGNMGNNNFGDGNGFGRQQFPLLRTCGSFIKLLVMVAEPRAPVMDSQTFRGRFRGENRVVNAQTPEVGVQVGAPCEVDR